MTDAERQARYRAARASGSPIVRTRRPADHRGKARRWNDAVSALVDLQTGYGEWLETIPENLRDGTIAGALKAICELDLTDLQAVIPPRGFGRD